ncbi:MAG: 3-deoxy-7-phosphoheptulonate synthase [Firmicutes bacterium]|nr:3-deoxy-7-phosphoheptulonate synthase [Bacillota bacterium]MDD7601843.1 3-deoxy-7-phosphoheptulonate synthase [Bacillota bacterium]MDY5855859.1 3-deoxy-7-phosphoheptulonate synthase [Anaerovoracaceae bacterium]
MEERSTFIRKLPIPMEIKERYPLTKSVTKIKLERDEEIAKVFKGESDKFLLIIGPCSADNEDSVMDYISRLAKVQEKVKDRIIIIPRIYTNKPRTTGQGYMGMVHQPDPEKEEDLLEGLIAIRRLHTRAIDETGLTCADEMLYPENYKYLSDLLAYVAVGARSVENQQHRLTASGMSVPVGMKNPTSGGLSVMLNSIIAAQVPHKFIYRGWEVKTQGNPLAHAILRGSVNKHGQNLPNYHYEDLRLLYDLYSEQNLDNMAVIVDTNHNNSGKKYLEQIRIAHEVMDSRRYSEDIRGMVKGLMIESYIEDGAQKIGEGTYGKSITDPCLGWEKSERLIYDIAERV